MSGAIINKLELDVMQVNELLDAVDLAVKYQIPAIVVHPSLVGEAFQTMGARQASNRIKLIIPVDWPRGEIFGMTKMRGIPTQAFAADGFEIYLTGGKSEIETRNEAKVLSEFMLDNVGQDIEIRFVLGMQMRDTDNIDRICKGLKGVRTPAYIRTDHQVKIQKSKANTELHRSAIEQIRKHVRFPLKLSGNIDNIRVITACPEATRFAVSLSQAKAIIKEVRQQPEQLSQMLR